MKGITIKTTEDVINLRESERDAVYQEKGDEYSIIIMPQNKEGKHEVKIFEKTNEIDIKSFPYKFWTKERPFNNFLVFITEYKKYQDTKKLKIELEKGFKSYQTKKKEWKESKNDVAFKEEYKPVSLTECKKIVYSWLSIEDEEVLDIVFAFTLSEELLGDPLWLFLIAPPGGCKTELLRAIRGNNFYHLSDLTSKTFVSGLMVGTGEERQKIDDLLPQLNGKILLFKDFTTVLEKQKDERREIIAQLREIYDGFYSKKFGTLDEKVEYTSRFGFVAGVTPIIDKHWKVMQQLGERFLKYRWIEEADRVTRKAEKDESKETLMRKEIKNAVMGFLTNLKVTEVVFPDKFVEPLIEVSKFLAVCRTPVTIHSGQSDFYYDFIPTPEMPTRLVKQLKKLCKALACVRSHNEVTESDVKTAINVALATSPQDRLKVLQTIQTLQYNTLDGCTIPQIKHHVSLPETSIRNICLQLDVLNMVTITNISKEAEGYRSYVTYYKLNEKICALSPVSFLDYSKKVGGESGGINIVETVKESEANEANVLDFPFVRPDGKRFRKCDTVFLPCVSCGAKHTEGWHFEDEQGKAPYCDICSGCA